ncbi:MAG: RNA polymerase sigma factor [Actinomycetota bacterium]
MEGRPLGDEELVHLARSGDTGAYELLVQRYQGLAQRVAYIVTGSNAEAEDAAQEAFVKAYYALPRFRSGSAFKPWLLRIVTNEARNRRRSAGRRTRLALKVESLDRTSGGAAPSPEATVASHEEAAALLAAVNSLSEKDRLAITYRYWLDLNEAEMAQVLGWPRGTVKSRLSRAMARLRSQLEEP